MIITLREGIKNQTHQHDIIFDIKPEEITETSQSLGTGNFGQVVKGKWKGKLNIVTSSLAGSQITVINVFKYEVTRFSILNMFCIT